MMESEITQELKENIEEMKKIIGEQLFKVEDAQRFLKRYFNILRKMQQLEISRDTWKYKYEQLKNKK